MKEKTYHEQTNINNALKAVKEYKELNKPEGALLLGVHLEGPYINKIYKGAQNEAFIREPNVDELKELNSLTSDIIHEGQHILVTYYDTEIH